MSDPLLLKVPPHNLDAEQAVLGAVLRDNRAITAVQVPDEAWYAAKHQAIWQCMHALARRGDPIDVVTLSAEIARQGFSERAPSDYLMELDGAVPTAANVEHYASLVVDSASLRDTALAGGRIQQLALARGAKAADVQSQAERVLMEALRAPTWSRLKQARTLAMDYYRHFQRVKAGEFAGYSSGFDRLDEITCGMRRGEMTVLAARPSMGKTALALALLLNLGRAGVPCGVLSLETGDMMLMTRFVSMLTGIDGRRLMQGQVSPYEERLVAEALAEFESLPISVDDAPSESVERVLGRIRAMATKDGAKVVAVDYMQMVKGSSKGHENRNREVAYISGELKAIARQLDIHLIALAQLSRKVEERSNKEPLLSDLRDSGDIEQDLDVCLMVHRPAYYPPKRDDPDPKVQREAFVYVQKNRNGPTGTVAMEFSRANMRWREAPRDDQGARS